MPNIIINAPEGVFDTVARAQLAKSVTEVAKAVEQGGDDPAQTALTWVLIDEFKPGTFFAGGADPLQRVIPVVVFFHYPAGVLDEAARAEAVRLLHEVISAAKPANDPRPIGTSVILTEVSDGAWGGNGRLLRLPDLARAAGYKHLQHLVVA
jgi:phenylpyruvate tautomerase PptA (4-oxalocrotonate tautomerase family)